LLNDEPAVQPANPAAATAARSAIPADD
jgi:hypothetical protein